MTGLPPLLRSASQAAAATGELRASQPQGGNQKFEYEENPRSLLTSVTGPLIGAVGAVGNLLDLPGSMVRDVLALKNPLDQIYNGPSSWFSDRDRVSGRQLLHRWGLASQNKETGISGWLSDPLEGVQDVAGFLVETALDPLNLLSRPAKALGTAAELGRPARGIAANLFDPLRLSEAGEKIGMRSARDEFGRRIPGQEGLVRKAIQKTGQLADSAAKATDKSPVVGEPFRILRHATGEAADSLRRNAAAMFDASVVGTTRKVVQPIMRAFWNKQADADLLIKVDARQLDARIRAAIRNDPDFGPDFFDKLRKGSASVDVAESRAIESAAPLRDAISAKLQSLGYQPKEIEELVGSFDSLISDRATIGSQAGLLTDWAARLEQDHVARAAGKIPLPSEIPEFNAWKSRSSGRIPLSVSQSLGWKKAGADYLNEALGVQVGRLSDHGNYWVSESGQMLPENFKSLGDAIEFVHSKARTAASDAASRDFDDIDSLLEAFHAHDKAAAEILSSAKAENLTDLDYYEELSSAALGIPDSVAQYRILKPELRDLIAKEVPPESSLIDRLQEKGWPTGQVDDPADLPFVARKQGDSARIEYESVRGKGEGYFESGADRVVDAPSPASTSRDEVYLGWPGGGPQINRFWRDPELAESIESVRLAAKNGEYRGLATPADIRGISDTLKSAGDEYASRLGDVITPDTGLAKPDDIARAANSIADEIESSGAGLRWVTGGWSQKKHVFDDLLSSDDNGAFKTEKISRASKDIDSISEADLLKSGLQMKSDAVHYQIARDEIASSRNLPQESIDDAKSMVDFAEKNGLPVFFRVRRNDTGQQEIASILVPRTKSTIANRLRSQAKNLKKKVTPDRDLSPEDLADIQRQSVLQFIRRRYNDVIDPVPLRNEHGARKIIDYRKGRETERTISNAEYDSLDSQGLAFDSAEAADQSGGIYQLVGSRHEMLADKVMSPDGGFSAYRKSGVFTNDPLRDRLDYRLNVQRAVDQSEAFDSLVMHFIRRATEDESRVYENLLSGSQKTAEYSLGTLLKKLEKTNGLSSTRYLKWIAKQKNPRLLALDNPAGLSRKAIKELTDIEKAEVNWLKKIQVDTEDFMELSEGLNFKKQGLADMPGLGGGAAKFIDAATQLFKVGVLAFPARIARDVISASYRTIESGLVKPNTAGLNSVKMGNAVATGKITEGFSELLRSRDFAEAFSRSHAYQRIGKSAGDLENGALTLNEAVYEFFRDTFYTAQGGSYHHTAMSAHDPLADLSSAGSLDALREVVPNQSRQPLVSLGKSLASDIASDIPAAMNPFNIQGMRRVFTRNPKLAGVPRPKSQFVVDRLANIAGSWSDATTRAAAVIDQMKRGVTFREAFRNAGEKLVSYDPRRFSRFEREIMKRVFPFYSFMSSQVPYVFKELATNPAGGLGRTVRAQRLSQDNEYVPSHMRDRAALPLSVTRSGDQNYISSLGLMHEDALAMANPDLADVLGDMNPLFKLPVELATGRSLFMRGPLGGEDLSELDPTVGRIRQGVRERLGISQPSSSRPEPFISNSVEHILANSPVSRWLNATRTLLDDRKTPAQRALNLLTGVKVTTVSPEQQQRMLRDEADAILKERGIRPFTRYHLKPEEIDEIEASGDTDTARRLRAVERVRAILDKSRRENRTLLRKQIKESQNG